MKYHNRCTPDCCDFARLCDLLSRLSARKVFKREKKGTQAERECLGGHGSARSPGQGWMHRWPLMYKLRHRLRERTVNAGLQQRKMRQRNMLSDCPQPDVQHALPTHRALQAPSPLRASLRTGCRHKQRRAVSAPAGLHTLCQLANCKLLPRRLQRSVRVLERFAPRWDTGIPAVGTLQHVGMESAAGWGRGPSVSRNA